MYVVVVPNICIEFHQSLCIDFAINKEISMLVLLKIPLINIDCQNNGTSCNERWAILQKLGIVALELANLVGHVVDSSVHIVI